MDTLYDHMPILSRGRHRNPRKGACFMELASYLAGERWSDHPACTHPLLAGPGPPGQRPHHRRGQRQARPTGPVDHRATG
ncbi:hypothetical protein [Nonomuraea dietziae]|uniref:hypothetical protein n=1 Tax=Nonomuraea dietziae TaxID=65515 RepID=UPI0031E2BA04